MAQETRNYGLDAWKNTPLNMRVSAETKQELIRRAQAAGMSLTEYVCRGALAWEPVLAEDVESKVADLERRVERLEQMAEGYAG